MSVRYFKRIKLLPGVTLNISKRGISVSLGIKGLRITFGKKRKRFTVGIPGSGIYYTKTSKNKNKKKKLV